MHAVFIAKYYIKIAVGEGVGLLFEGVGYYFYVGYIRVVLIREGGYSRVGGVRSTLKLTLIFVLCLLTKDWRVFLFYSSFQFAEFMRDNSTITYVFQEIRLGICLKGQPVNL